MKIILKYSKHVLLISTLSIISPVKAIFYTAPITYPLCAGRTIHNVTCFPNFFDSSQEDTFAELHRYFPFNKAECSPALRPFLCSLYFPDCDVNVLSQPCRELCERSRRDCEGLMMEFGFRWPDKWNCENFLYQIDNPQCPMPEDPKYSTTSIPSEGTGQLLAETKEGNCQLLDTTFCAGQVPYRTTTFPNLLNHENKFEASRQLDMYTQLMNFSCTPSSLRLFLCSTYAPYCEEPSGSLLPPCRELCEQAVTGCIGRDNVLGFVWPEELDCQNFPLKESVDICIMPDYFNSSEDVGGGAENITEAITALKVTIEENMKALQTENSQLRKSNENLIKQVADLKEDLAANRENNVHMMEEFEIRVMEKVHQLETRISNTITNSATELSNQIHESCDD